VAKNSIFHMKKGGGTVESLRYWRKKKEGRLRTKVKKDQPNKDYRREAAVQREVKRSCQRQEKIGCNNFFAEGRGEVGVISQRKKSDEFYGGAAEVLCEGSRMKERRSAYWFAF